LAVYFGVIFNIKKHKFNQEFKCGFSEDKVVD